ncbi:MAG: helix-turn-helix domain-containing protein [bacterium]
MESFGAFIKSEREKKGISLKEISNVTKISHHVLEALESDHVEEFPYPAFAKGFLHTYAKQLGLNSNEIISRYVDFVMNTYPIGKNGVLFDDRKQLGRVSFDQNKILTRAERIREKRIFPAFIIIVLIVGIWFAWSIFIKQTSLSMNKTDRDAFLSKKIEKLHAGLPVIEKEILNSSETDRVMTDESAIENTHEHSSGFENAAIASFGIESTLMSGSKIEKSLMETQTAKKEDDELPIEEKKFDTDGQTEEIVSSEFSSAPLFTALLDARTPVKEAYGEMVAPKKELIIKAMQMTWIDAKIDNNPNYDFLLYPGDVVKLEAQSKFSLLIGNAGGVTFTYDGEPLGPIGKPEEVVRLNLPK